MIFASYDCFGRDSSRGTTKTAYRVTCIDAAKCAELEGVGGVCQLVLLPLV